MLFSPEKVRIIKSFSLRGPAKSVRISKNLNYREVRTIQVFHESLLGDFEGTEGFRSN